MPIESVVPACSAPAERLSLAAGTVRSGVSASNPWLSNGYCFAEDDASPSSTGTGLANCAPYCFAADE